MKAEKPVWIVDGARIPFGTFGGALKNLTATEITTVAARGTLEKTGIRPDMVEHVILGNVIQSSPDAIYFARHVGLKCGVPIPVGAITINRLCGSGLESLAVGARMLLLDEVDVVMAGGGESMSQAPHIVRGARWGFAFGRPPAMEDYLWASLTDSYVGKPMGITAENLAIEYKLSREDVDRVAFDSQQRAAAAREEGRFDSEIVPVEVKARKKTMVFEQDEHLRPETTMETLAGLRPVFSKDGVVTAGNASGICDGAAVFILANDRGLEKLGVEPVGQLIAWHAAGVEPSLMGIGPAPATRRVLEDTGLTFEDIDLFEYNEAFAAQYLAVERELGLPGDRTNIWGGAIAIGHPLGGTGAWLTLTLLNKLKTYSKKRGLVSMCIGGGQGIAAIIEAI